MRARLVGVCRNLTLSRQLKFGAHYFLRGLYRLTYQIFATKMPKNFGAQRDLKPKEQEEG